MNNVLIVIADACRYDAPGIDELFEGAVYHHAWSCGSATIPAFASLFTGMLPHEHGAVFRRKPKTPPNSREKWLDARLEREGYNVLSVTENPFTRWCGHYVSKSGRPNNWDAQGEGFDLIPSMMPEEPWAVIYHSMITHFPYGNRGRHLKPAFKSENPSARDELWKHYVHGVEQFVREYQVLEEALSPDVAIVTSDHGEAFYEHKFYGHPIGRLYGYLLRVPLIVRDGKRNRNYNHPISMVEFPELVLKAAGGTRTMPQAGSLCYSEGYRRDGTSVNALRVDDWVAFRFIDETVYYNAVEDPLSQDLKDDHEKSEWFAPHIASVPARPGGDAEAMGDEDEKAIEERLRNLGYVD